MDGPLSVHSADCIICTVAVVPCYNFVCLVACKVGVENIVNNKINIESKGSGTQLIIN